MGRARSNLKRRPKGKRGWRKIDADSMINPPEDTSLEAEQERILQSRNSQLWSQDLRPRDRVRKKRTKAQKRLRAKHNLLKRGFAISSIEGAKQTKNQIASYHQEQRLLSWKTKQRVVKHNQPIAKKQAKQSAILKFSNTTKKKVLLKSHKNIALNKKHVKNNTDYNKNNAYLYKIKHDKNNAKNEAITDLWGGPKSRKPKRDESSYSDTESDDSNDANTDLPDVHAQNIIRAQRKASKCEIKSKRSVYNGFVPNVSLLSLPKQGESINPIKKDYYFMKWKAFELRAKQKYKHHYQTRGTEKWFKENLQNTSYEDNVIEALREKANKMKKLYMEHSNKYNNAKQLVMNEKNTEKEEDNEDKTTITRKISQKQRKRDLSATRWNSKKRHNARRKIQKLSKKNGGHIWGPRYRFKQRSSQPMDERKIGNSLRNTVHAGTDHPVNFMFHEMQKRNKVHGARRNHFVLPRKKAFLGARYKVQTRIGKLHHANIHNKYFTGIDD